MKEFYKTFKMLRFYLTSSILLRILNYLGLISLAVFGLLTLIYDSPPYMIAALGLLLILFGPTMLAGILFRQLASNRQLTLAPGLTIHALKAVLVLVTIDALIFGCFIDSAPFLFSALQLFTAISVFTLFIMNASKKIAPFIWLLPSIILISLLNLPAAFYAFILHPITTLIYSSIALLAWSYTFFYVSRTSHMTSIHLTMNTSNPEALTNLKILLESNSPSSSAESLFNNSFINFSSRLKKMFLLVFILPFVITFLLSMLNLESVEDGYIAGLFMFFSLFPATFVMFGHVELLPRSRLLWLHVGNCRKDIWTFIEKNIKNDLLALYLVSFSITLLLFLSPVSLKTIGTYLMTTICCSIFFPYFGIYCRIMPSTKSTVILMAGTIISAMALFLFIMVAYTESYNNWPIFYFNLVILSLGIGFRSLSIRSFVKIDWARVKPLKLQQ